MKKNEDEIKKPLLDVTIAWFKKTGITSTEVIATVISFAVSAFAFICTNKSTGGVLAGHLVYLVLIYMLFVFFTGRRLTGRKRTPAEVQLLSLLTAVYFITAVALRNFHLFDGYMPSSIAMPTALVIMLIVISIDSRLAMTIALALPLGAFFTGCINEASFAVAIISGAAGSLVLHGARRRMDLVKAGIIVALANSLTVLAVLLVNGCPLSKYPFIIFWAVINGVVSGMLVLGILPIIENALHLATTFKLIELLDLNSPVLRKLLTQAPGTYSHSMMVANLAEEACREIGAKALLARVGAYYHDIGKIDNPDYFVENQTASNKHNNINPRLSATVIRSHVKLGVEKARAAGLPSDVIDIIGEHHGNSLIQWFYNAAMEKEGKVDAEDFSYPGNPPHSRESAVVMLADVSEAASRTLEKPTVANLEKFIQDLFDNKVKHNQLAESALTFHDLEIIKKVFVRMLAGHYHSRIEYPKEGDK
ncbi:hypothetical protein FACS189494_06290 [Spirochaetia bacterium]|nr:hypothetical protein FACS189494_06290 [Spirochaetia bacterium]